MYRIGIDTGGTNTDVVMTDLKSGALYSTKTPTTTYDLIEGIRNGIKKISNIAGALPSQIDELIYGTTIVVNMIAQKEAEATALITTAGFRDVLEIGRAYRNENIYDIFMDKPIPLVKRDLRFEVSERINFKGEVVCPINDQEIISLIGILKNKKIKSIGVCLLHSYTNPIHERRIKELFKIYWPEVHISISSDINPQFREYERTSTTVINAYMMPNMDYHLVALQDNLKEQKLNPRSYIMQGNAGVMTFNAALDKPVSVSDSGPIAGIIAANYLGKLSGIKNMITLDMGGTSCDVALIQNNTLQFTTDSHIDGYPISIPTVDLNFIGAGGGSIAWYDAGGALKVGPKSAGAFPGPVCYRRGGTEPTVTDANLVTGRIRPEIFMEDLTSVMEKTQEAIWEKVAKPLKMSTMEAAEGILQVVNSNMISAIKLVSVQKGYDPREFTLVSFGGAGGLHAAKLAAELEMPEVLVPYSPGTFSALGLVLSDIKHDFVHTRLLSEEQLDSKLITEIFESLDEQGMNELEKEGVAEENRMLLRTCDIRYFGQAFELSVPIKNGSLTDEDLKIISKHFHEIHERTYGHSMPEDPIEWVNYRVSAVGKLSKPDLSGNNQWETGIDFVQTTKAKVILDGQEYEVPIIDRNRLKSGDKILGPAIIGEMGSTTIVYPNMTAHIDPMKNIRIKTGY